VLIADRAALLLLDAEGGRRLSSPAAATVLAGALLTDLVLRGRLDTDPETGVLRVRPGVEPEPRLAAALAVVAASSGHPGRSVRALTGRRLWDQAMAALAAESVVSVERWRRFLVFSWTRWHPDPVAVDGARTSVRAAVAAARKRRGTGSVDPATVSLVALLAGAGCLWSAVPTPPGGSDSSVAAERLTEARDLPAEVLEALRHIEIAVATRVHALSAGGSASDGGSSGSDDGGGSDGGGGGGGD
jgi:hypothetical protein